MGEVLLSISLETPNTKYSKSDRQKVVSSFEGYFNKSINKDDISDSKKNTNNENSTVSEENTDNNSFGNDKKEVIENTTNNNITKEKEVTVDEVVDKLEEKDEIESEIMNILSTLLNIDIKDIKNFIKNNEVTMGDIKNFIIKELNLSEATDLLNLENIGETLKELNNLVDNLVDLKAEIGHFEEVLEIGNLNIDNENIINNEIGSKVNNTIKNENSYNVLNVTKNEPLEKDKSIEENLDEKIEPLDKKELKNLEIEDFSDEVVSMVTDTEKSDIPLDDLELDFNENIIKNEEVVTETTNQQDNKEFKEGNNFLNYTTDEQNNIFGVASENIEVENINNLKEFPKQTFRNLNPQEVVRQLVDNVKLNFDPSFTEIKIQLSPENLGNVTLKVVTENGIIMAQFVAENEKVKEIIESNFTDLSDTLKERGLNVSGLSVSVGQDDSSNQERLNHFNRNKSKSEARVKEILKGLEDNAPEDLEYADSIGLTQSTVSYSV